MGWTVWDSIPSGGQDVFFPFQNVHTHFRAHSESYWRILSLEVQRPGSEVPLVLSVCGIYRNTFTIYSC